MKAKAMKLTESEARTVYVIFDELVRMRYSDLNSFLGSVTIQEMQELHKRIRCADYCERNGIAFEDMTEADFEEVAMEEAREAGYAV